MYLIAGPALGGVARVCLARKVSSLDCVQIDGISVFEARKIGLDHSVIENLHAVTSDHSIGACQTKTEVSSDKTCLDSRIDSNSSTYRLLDTCRSPPQIDRPHRPQDCRRYPLACTIISQCPTHQSGFCRRTMQFCRIRELASCLRDESTPLGHHHRHHLDHLRLRWNLRLPRAFCLTVC